MWCNFNGVLDVLLLTLIDAIDCRNVPEVTILTQKQNCFQRSGLETVALLSKRGTRHAENRSTLFEVGGMLEMRS